MNQSFSIHSLADIAAIEKVPFQERVKENSTFELLEKGAGINPDALALRFLFSGEAYEQPTDITYRQLIGKIRQTANMFNDLGIGAHDVVTYLLPNIPQTHYVLWGAEAAGIANPINPLLEAANIKEICCAAGTKVLVAL